MPPGHGHERRKRNLRYLMLAIIVGVVASSLFVAFYYLFEGPNPVMELPVPPSVVEKRLSWSITPGGIPSFPISAPNFTRPGFFKAYNYDRS